jgi:hypothetical protein
MPDGLPGRFGSGLDLLERLFIKGRSYGRTGRSISNWLISVNRPNPAAAMLAGVTTTAVTNDRIQAHWEAASMGCFWPAETVAL